MTCRVTTEKVMAAPPRGEGHVSSVRTARAQDGIDRAIFPLASLAGAVPKAPQWFDAALAHLPERSSVEVEGAGIELLTWGDVGKPGLMLVHGNSAHADWWRFIAPFLARDFRVAALSLSGFGDSGWRETYRFDLHAAEIHACALQAGLYRSTEKPVLVGHSYGGAHVFYSAGRYPERMKAAILIDAEFGDPPAPGEDRGPLPPIRERRADGKAEPFRIYDLLEDALRRFRFAPPQSPHLLCAADLIARTSLKRVPRPDGLGDGWTWKFDPCHWDSLDHGALRTVDPRAMPPIALIWGENSPMTRRYDAGGLTDYLLSGLPSIVIPDAAHHVMVDQPLALTAALLALAAAWPDRVLPENIPGLRPASNRQNFE